MHQRNWTLLTSDYKSRRLWKWSFWSEETAQNSTVQRYNVQSHKEMRWTRRFVCSCWHTIKL